MRAIAWCLSTCILGCGGGGEGPRADDGTPAAAPSGAPGGGSNGSGDGGTDSPQPPDASGVRPVLEASPSHVSMFGQVDVQLEGDFTKLGTVTEVTVGGIRALDIRTTLLGIAVYLQGAPTPGPASIVITGSAGSITSDSALAYDPPPAGVPMKWAGFGASLTQGFQSGGLSAHGQIMSWDAQVARAAGVFLAPPLFDDAFLPPMKSSAFATDCNASQDAPTIAGGAINALSDPNSIGLDLRRPRKDPTLPTRNFAVGGATVADIVQPATFPIGVIERVTEQPDGDPTNLLAASSLSQVARLAALDPDVALCADLLANDSDGSVTQSDDLHPEQMTDLATITSQLKALTVQLGALHGDYFIGNLLPLDGLPNVAVLRAQNVPKVETQQAFDAKLDQVRSVIKSYNVALAAAAAPYPNLHIVNLFTPTTALLANGLDVGTAHLTGKEFGGLLSLDFVHFSDTGYAFLANVFIDVINRTKGWRIPSVDIAQVLANDALSPASLKAAGVNCPPL